MDRTAFTSATTLSAMGLIALAASGCATVFKGSQQTVRIESDPAGAAVETSGQLVGRTPTTTEVDRNGSTNFTVSAPGYADGYGQLRKRPDVGWWVADLSTCVIPVLLCVPLVVDAISGAWFNVDENYRVMLRPKEAGAATLSAAQAPAASPAPPTIPAATSSAAPTLGF